MSNVIHTSMESFLNSMQRSWNQNDFLNDWKDQGKTVGWIHPKIGIGERLIHGSIPSMEKNDKGEVQARFRKYNCVGEKDNCPLCLIVKWANQMIAEGIDPNEVILDGGERKTRKDKARTRETRKNSKRKRETKTRTNRKSKVRKNRKRKARDDKNRTRKN